ncbi:MAG: ATP-binding cassette domain-containing protein, partial [Lachnospiraceae bacterium]|nr:ATP-binding cassette domain-containing protein [Lachnospiraceae bacterium]
MTNILETMNLCKSYKAQKANDNISIHIPKNSIYGLLGPNGAGKSTFLKMITGMIAPSSGTIMLEGKEWKREDLAGIGSLIEGA